MELCDLNLAQCVTILRTTINSTTMKRYLKVSSSIHINQKELDVLLDTHSLESQCIKDFLSEVKRWEFMLNRRELAIMKMALCVHEKFKNKHLDILESATYDWNVLGIFCDFGLSERAQCISDKMKHFLSTYGLPIAFLLPDLTFLGTDRTTIPQ